MLLGEMCLLVAAVLVMTGLVKKITARLYVNDFIATFFIFTIVLLNVRGGIDLNSKFSLFLGGAISVLIALYVFFRRSETFSEAALGLFGFLSEGAIAFFYTYVFFSARLLDPRWIALLLSVFSGVWCALVSKRTFASCFFSAIVGSFGGITLYQVFVQKSGEIGGGYAFAVMWMSALFGLLIQHLLTLALRAVNSPRASTLFEAGELEEEDGENKKETISPKNDPKRP